MIADNLKRVTSRINSIECNHEVQLIAVSKTRSTAEIQEAVNADGGEVTVVSGEGQELFSDSLASEGQEGDTYINMFKHNVNLIVSNLK